MLKIIRCLTFQTSSPMMRSWISSSRSLFRVELRIVLLLSPDIFSDITEETSYQTLRLVFCPYSRVQTIDLHGSNTQEFHRNFRCLLPDLKDISCTLLNIQAYILYVINQNSQFKAGLREIPNNRSTQPFVQILQLIVIRFKNVNTYEKPRREPGFDSMLKLISP